MAGAHSDLIARVGIKRRPSLCSEPMHLKTHALAGQDRAGVVPGCRAAGKRSGHEGWRPHHPEERNEGADSRWNIRRNIDFRHWKNEAFFGHRGGQRDAPEELVEEAVPQKKQGKPGLCAGLRAETLR